MTSATPPSALATMKRRGARGRTGREIVQPTVLRSGGSISTSIPYEPARPVKPGKAAADQVDECEEVRRVADVCGEEAMERVRQPSEHEREDPGRRRDEEHRERPEHDPDEVRDREEEAEEDREPRPLEVVGDDDAHGVLRELARTARPARGRSSGSAA